MGNQGKVIGAKLLNNCKLPEVEVAVFSFITAMQSYGYRFGH